MQLPLTRHNSDEPHLLTDRMGSGYRQQSIQYHHPDGNLRLLRRETPGTQAGTDEGFFQQAIIVSTNARFPYPMAFCQASRPLSCIMARWRSRCPGGSVVSSDTAVERGGMATVMFSPYPAIVL